MLEEIGAARAVRGSCGDVSVLQLPAFQHFTQTFHIKPLGRLRAAVLAVPVAPRSASSSVRFSHSFLGIQSCQKREEWEGGGRGDAQSLMEKPPKNGSSSSAGRICWLVSVMELQVLGDVFCSRRKK